jgi:hypothetical protein
MKKILYSLVTILFLTFNLNALPSVTICGWDGSGSTSGAGDEFSFVLLRDFAAGEVIYFTEDEYSIASGNFFIGEGHLAYTIPAGGLLENEVVRILDTGNDIFAVQCAGGTAVKVAGTGNWSFSNVDEIYAYSASNPASPWSSITEVHCFIFASNISPNADQIVSGEWPNSIYIGFNLNGPGGVNADFKDPPKVNTTLAMLQNGANWDQVNIANTNITLSCTDFTNNMLPIELISFDARLRGNEVLFDWATATEVNNERFEIEHSTDNQIFSLVGTVAGKGTSYEKNSYKLVDYYPNIGINYYRLKQIDYDGKYDYSEIVYVRNYLDTGISLYPNPAKEHITINSSNILTNQQFLVYDAMGRQINLSSSKENEYTVRLNTSSLESGIYFIKLSSGNLRKVIKL